jgi:hypothetical protein
LYFLGCVPYRNNKYSNDFSTLSGAISIAGPGGAFARAGNAVASSGSGGAIAQAGNAIAQAGNILTGGGFLNQYLWVLDKPGDSRLLGVNQVVIYSVIILFQMKKLYIKK